MNLNIIQLFILSTLKLHFFCYILCVHHSCVLVYVYPKRMEHHFHSGRSLIFTDKFTVYFKCLLLGNYLSDLVQTYSDYY